MIRGIIFDMDGVLTDSEPAITRAVIEALLPIGIKADAMDFKEFTGMGDDKFVGGVMEKYGKTYDPIYKLRAYDIYLSTAKERVKVFPWSKKLILSLLRDGYSVCIASASDQIKVLANLSCIGILPEQLASIVTGSDIEHNKPAPDIFLKAAEKAGIKPAQCLVCEDALSGVRAAKAAGMTAVAVTTSFPPDPLRLAGADHVVDSLNDLPSILKTMSAKY